MEFELVDEFEDLEECNPYLAQTYRKLRNIQFSYHIMHLSADEVDDIFEFKVFENPEQALEYYITTDNELLPKLKCVITGTLGVFSYSCLAPLTLSSLAEIADAENGLPERIKDKATKALAKRIHYDLPFHSHSHGFVI